MKMDDNESAENRIEKQAMLEAIFGSEIWSETYIKNPFLYVTDLDSDFQGPNGIQLYDLFKKMFYINYTKYTDIIKKVEPKEYFQ